MSRLLTPMSTMSISLTRPAQQWPVGRPRCLPNEWRHIFHCEVWEKVRQVTSWSSRTVIWKATNQKAYLRSVVQWECSFFFKMTDCPSKHSHQIPPPISYPFIHSFIFYSRNPHILHIPYGFTVKGEGRGRKAILEQCLIKEWSKYSNIIFFNRSNMKKSYYENKPTILCFAKQIRLFLQEWIRECSLTVCLPLNPTQTLLLDRNDLSGDSMVRTSTSDMVGREFKPHSRYTYNLT